MSDQYTTATEGAVLAMGRAPEWDDAAFGTEPPAAASDGCNLEDALKTLVYVSLREDAHHRTVRLGTTFVATGTYHVFVDGNEVTYSGSPADLAALVDGIASAINGDSTVNQIVTAVAVDADDTTSGAHVKVRLRGLGEADYSVDFTHSSTGSPTLTAVADLCTAKLRRWWTMSARAGSTAPVPWVSPDDAVDVDRHGFVARYDSGGLARLFVQLSDRAGHSADGPDVTFTSPNVQVGPCLAEDDG